MRKTFSKISSPIHCKFVKCNLKDYSIYKHSRNTALTITDLLMLIRVDPTGTLKTANASVHDITHDGLLDTLGIIKGLDVGEAEK